MKDTLTIEDLRTKLFYSTGSYEGYKLTQDKKSVIEQGEVGMFLVELPPKQFNRGTFDTFIATLIILESKDNTTYKDDVALKVILTKTDFDMLTNTLKVEIGDKIVATGKTFKSKKGFVVNGRSWTKIKSDEKKKQEIEDKGISLE